MVRRVGSFCFGAMRGGKSYLTLGSAGSLPPAHRMLGVTPSAIRMVESYFFDALRRREFPFQCPSTIRASISAPRVLGVSISALRPVGRFLSVALQRLGIFSSQPCSDQRVSRTRSGHPLEAAPAFHLSIECQGRGVTKLDFKF